MGVHKKPTQNQRILNYIEQFGSITQLEALRDLGVMRLASRISDLRKQGHKIVSEVVPVKNRFEEQCHIKRYRFEEELKVG
ncbi:MAG: helix-turn-helix domain-containing protein [Clostridia bacterium]|nr:helix-turn-helix domain-containing protein [Clostridia bacterium]